MKPRGENGNLKDGCGRALSHRLYIPYPGLETVGFPV